MTGHHSVPAPTPLGFTIVATVIVMIMIIIIIIMIMTIMILIHIIQITNNDVDNVNDINDTGKIIKRKENIHKLLILIMMMIRIA